jgi:SAM-dependent methyltransferase
VSQITILLQADTVDPRQSPNPERQHLSVFKKRHDLRNTDLELISFVNERQQYTSRADFLAQISPLQKGLEIGPFANPLLNNPNVKYLDVLPTEQLKVRASTLGMDPELVPLISYIADENGFPEISESFDYLLSCHSIEHQPDLVKHLNQVEQILLPGGKYFLIIPDKRYCFDHYIAESTIADVVGAYLEQRTVHTAKSVIEHRALTTHNDPVEHFAGNHGDLSINQHDRVSHAINECRNANGSYIDVHAWQFTPNSFIEIIGMLNDLKLIKFKITSVFQTALNTQEFFATLELVER